MSKKNLSRYVQVKNGKDVLTVDTIGAQVVSWKVNGLEVMYQGALDSQDETKPVQPAWAATAKNLFPNPGPMGSENDRFGEPIYNEDGTFSGRHKLQKLGKNTTYFHNGGVYQMGQHGFAQSEEYKVLSKVNLNEHTGIYEAQNSDIVLTITDELNETWDKYPYKFAHSLVYSLTDNGSICYESHAQNNDNKPMVAGQGWHPAFKLHGNPSDYRLEIRNLKKKKGCEESCALQEGQLIDIYTDVISPDKSVHYGGIAEADLVLLYKKPDGNVIEYLSMHTTQPELILWSRKAQEEGQEHFIAIEPWNSPSRIISELTTQDKTEELAKKDAVIVPPARSAYERQQIMAKELEKYGDLTEIERKYIWDQLSEKMQREDSVLRVQVSVNEEYGRYFTPNSEME